MTRVISIGQHKHPANMTKCPRTDYDILQSDIDALIKLSNNWLLNFNLDKYVSMHILVGKKCENHQYQFTIESSVHNLELVTNIKDLCVKIDDQLCFEEQINETN